MFAARVKREICTWCNVAAPVSGYIRLDVVLEMVVGEASREQHSEHTLVLPARRVGARQAPLSGGKSRTVGARIAMSAPATARLLQMIAAGVDDYVISSADGRISVRGRVSIESVDCAEQCLPNTNVIVDWSRAQQPQFGPRKANSAPRVCDRCA